MLKRLRHHVLVFMSRRMIACDEAGFLISYKQEEHLGFYKWMQLKMHLLTCHLCRKYAIQIKQLDHKVAEYGVISSHEDCQHHLSDEACTKIQQTVNRELNVK